MAVVPLEKIIIVLHKSIKESFLKELQKEGIVHITELQDSPARVTSPTLENLTSAISQLAAYRKKSALETFVSLKTVVSYDEFVNLRTSYDYKKTLEELERIKKEKEECRFRLRNLIDDITLLTPWSPLNYDLSLLKTFKKTEAVPAIIPSKEAYEELFKRIEPISHSFEQVNSLGSRCYIIFFVRKEDSQGLRTQLIESGCELVQFGELVGLPAHLIASLNHRVSELNDKIDKLEEREKELSEELTELKIVRDQIFNEFKKEEISASLPETASTTTIIGWIKKKHLKRLKRLVEESELAAFDIIEPEPNEKPPVALENKKIVSAYEMLIRLYGMPNPKEYDPTPFLAFFFPLFFGLCITDAVYGIVLILFSLYLARRVVGDRSLIWILLAGGIFTIFTGAMVGSWVGNLFDLIGFTPLVKFKNSLMLFDPLTNPMVFVAIALGLGFIHMLIGIAIEVFDLLRNGDYPQAVFANFTWLILLPSIILYFTLFKSVPIVKLILEIIMWLCVIGIIVFSSQEGKPSLFDHLIWAVIVPLIWIKISEIILGVLFKFKYTLQLPAPVFYVVIPLLVIEIIRFKQAKKVLGKIAWGLYNFYSLSNYLGVVLSYVRLMALGMVTGVIAMAINIIAWMIIKIPVIGVILGILILVPSHLFNIAINCLGGFIHTMRLQYIEFFGRFYTGGGKPFRPFGLETKYVEIKS